MSNVSSRVPILMYHQVTEQPVGPFRKYAITPRSFALQMKWLSLAGYQAISLDDLLKSRSGEAHLSARPVVITFDDGFRDCVRHTAPILQRHGFTATYFLVAGLMAGSSRWLRESHHLEFPLLDWSTARGLVADGFTCGSHTFSHPHLSWLAPEQYEHELASSREVLQHELGRAVDHLAYPFGDFSPDIRMCAARIGYRTASTVRIGFATDADDLLALSRVPITGQDSLLDFVCRLRTGGRVIEVLQGKVQLAGRPFRRVWGVA